MGHGDDDVCARGFESGNELLCCCARGAVIEVWWEGVDCAEPFAFAEADEANFDAVGGGERVGTQRIAKGSV